MPWKVALTWILPLLAALNWLIRLLKATPLAAPRPCQTVMSVTPLAFFRADASGTDDPLPSPLEVELQAAEPAMTVTAMTAAANLFFMTLPSDQKIRISGEGQAASAQDTAGQAVDEEALGEDDEEDRGD